MTYLPAAARYERMIYREATCIGAAAGGLELALAAGWVLFGIATECARDRTRFSATD
jgi:hypothetical protein